MTTTTINGKEYRLRARVGDVNRLVKKYKKEIDAVWNKSEDKSVRLDEDKTGQFITELIWKMLCPRFFFKPFITIKRFSEMIELNEFNTAGQKAFLLMHGLKPEQMEDKEPGNRIS